MGNTASSLPGICFLWQKYWNPTFSIIILKNKQRKSQAATCANLYSRAAKLNGSPKSEAWYNSLKNKQKQTKKPKPPENLKGRRIKFAYSTYPYLIKMSVT